MAIVGIVMSWVIEVTNDKPKISKSEGVGAIICLQTKASVIERAQEVEANLVADFPSFVKPMLPSHVTGGFWLGLPKRFCNLHLPRHDETVILLDGSGEEYRTKYLADKNGLSGGWRGFSIAHKLLEGDVLVFQLIEPCKFKVYIVRANDLTEIDGAIGLLCLDACAKPMDIDQIENNAKQKDVEKWLQPIPLDHHQENIKKDGVMVLSDLGPPASDQSIDNGDQAIDNGDYTSFEGIRFSESTVDFKDVKCFENFTILVDGLVMDSQVPQHLRVKYYELCRSQEAFLHDHLVKGLNFNLAAGIISETVNIADAIRASKPTTSQDDFTTWDRTLKAFEDLGMNVGFLRARLNRLLTLAYESQKVIESKRVERIQAVEEMKTLEAQRLEVELVIKSLDAEIESMKLKGERLELKFQEEANAIW
ncbi:B3 domain-containing protein Os01g0234100-like [Cornus florida]|uniref:B3 domain-containing protein Os01g0234100-like n=1 Tax=Cornus florida TaxID=4283 RepID=UPI0028993FC3|nr:B3 domain-containing protein Os01g0234100-like [Cornus florida]